MGARAIAIAVGVVAALARPAAAERCPTPKAQLDAAGLPSDPEAQADTLFARATAFFDHKDYAAAAVVYHQAERKYAALAAGDTHAQVCATVAQSNAATAFSQASMPVEAVDAFHWLIDHYALDDAEQKRVDAAIASLEAQIGTLQLDGLPDGAEVRVDGLAVKLELARTAQRIAAGTHAVEVTARFYQPFLEDVTVVGGEASVVTVELAALDTPASVRIEANLARAHVELDGEDHGDAPLELTLAPGRHDYVVRAATYREHRASIELRPGERTILHVDLVPARAPWGVRGELYGVVIGGLGGDDDPFAGLHPGLGALVFHPYLRFRSFWFGFGVELHARQLDTLGAGGVVKWCPESTQFWRGGAQWCPGMFGGYLTAPHEGLDELQSGQAWMKLGSSLELRAGPFAFVRITPTFEWMGYSSPTDGEAWGYGIGLEMSAGIEL